MSQVGEKAMVISSDGHASARMEDYREYLDPEWREEFDGFCVVYREHGLHNFDPPSLLGRCDPDVVDEWSRAVLETGRIEGEWDVARRLVELEQEGVVGEVLFPDFGLPFELYPPLLATARGHAPRTPAQIDAANRAYNRWLADFCSQAPARFAGLAVVSFDDVDRAVDEIRFARAVGLRGVVLPCFDAASPVFDLRYEPIWNTIEELQMPVNSHLAISSVTNYQMPLPTFPHPACSAPIIGAQLTFFCRELLTQLIWGGVLDRHPDMQVVLTEQNSAWVVGALQGMDYSYEGSYLRRDIRDIVRLRPSEYFARQCHLGSSLLSRDEVRARHEIGIDKMMFGVDYPHHEGTFAGGTKNYIGATFGAACAPIADARKMLGENAANLWGFDAVALASIVDRVGFTFDELLTPPSEDLFPRGDVNKPIGSGFSTL